MGSGLKFPTPKSQFPNIIIMYLYGAGGLAKLTIDILLSNNQTVDGLFDDNDQKTEILGYPIYETSRVQSPVIITIGNNKVRKMIVEKLVGFEFGTAIHPSAVVSRFATIGIGSIIMQNSVIQPSSQVGKHCLVAASSTVDHDCVVEDFVHLAPNSILCGDVTVGTGTWVGAGSTITQGVRIGKWCVIDAGSVVTESIPDNTHIISVKNKTTNQFGK